MTIEELEKQVGDLQAEKEAMSAKNKELLGEIKRLKAKNNDAVDAEKYAELETKFDELKSENDKLVKKYDADVKKLNADLANGSLNRYLIDAGLSDNLAKAGVKAEFLEAAKALLRGQASLKDEKGELKAYIADKPISEFVSEWAQKDGKAFIAAPQGQGGGAGGSNNAAGAGAKWGGNREERIAAINEKFNLKE
ncbi:hypothetical protein [uncultured Campylobacter sp.]|uniref:hypothetical protein n=1 Tax=uncultured Campylobacter sp. TaxID=218934 RepID=UPI00262A12B0|nr:hypothetical protein [uncultured Campylobacter sp.]